MSEKPKPKLPTDEEISQWALDNMEPLDLKIRLGPGPEGREVGSYHSRELHITDDHYRKSLILFKKLVSDIRLGKFSEEP